MSRLVPSFSEHIKPRARIVSLAIVIENPDGELVMVRPDDIQGFTLDVETHWESIPYGSRPTHQTGRRWGCGCRGWSMRCCQRGRVNERRRVVRAY